MIKDLEKKYNIQKKENELVVAKAKTLELEKRNRDEVQNRRIIFGVSFLIILLLSLFYYLRYTSRIRKEHQHFSRQLISSIEEERKRISMDLHDDVGQSLSVIKANMSRHPELMTEIGEDLSKVIDQTRNISRNLFPSYLEKIGLQRAVAALCESVQNASGIVCSFEVCGEVETLSLEAKTHLYRIVQECINNTVKHSGASALKVEIIQNKKEFSFEYKDNGKGIEDDKAEKGLGLLSIAHQT